MKTKIPVRDNSKFHSQQKGLIDAELVKGKDDKWAMIQHWESMDDVKEAIKLMMQESSTEEFRQVVDPKTVKISLLEQIKIWNKNTYRDRDTPHRAPLPHHAAYGSVLRDSADQAESDPGGRKPK